ncbi:SOS response-associated peptidase [Kaistella sp. G5-32]|uniref:Abasic site processing protein n=1 Tax=Kaistella gelatinilytica TaxID=2787636 RepID=A0ABS0F8Z5_9FLAO|nr:SOS response-associated peptidase [Kaistella gelatinilytica]MBF8456176.1 SOS response-associated peptidase [Kaistella gelatinilytica]
MCYYVDSSLTKKEIKEVYGVGYEGEDFEEQPFLNGFSHPLVAVILDENPTVATSANWGLIPSWATDRKIQKQTLNARVETVAEKSSFRNNYNKRCLVLVKGFYEWKWIDAKGKEKQKHFLTLPNTKLIALGGIYGNWTDKETGETLTTFSIVTTEANELMTEIHNTKHRMPIVLTKAKEQEWLSSRDIQDFAFPNHEADLVAVNMDEPPIALTLF